PREATACTPPDRVVRADPTVATADLSVDISPGVRRRGFSLRKERRCRKLPEVGIVTAGQVLRDPRLEHGSLSNPLVPRPAIVTHSTDCGRVAGVRVPRVRLRTCAVRLGINNPARVKDNHPFQHLRRAIWDKRLRERFWKPAWCSHETREKPGT